MYVEAEECKEVDLMVPLSSHVDINTKEGEPTFEEACSIRQLIKV